MSTFSGKESSVRETELGYEYDNIQRELARMTIHAVHNTARGHRLMDRAEQIRAEWRK